MQNDLLKVMVLTKYKGVVIYHDFSTLGKKCISLDDARRTIDRAIQSLQKTITNGTVNTLEETY
jgi:hypothetical protein